MRLLLLSVLMYVSASTVDAAQHRTANFFAMADTREIAKAVATKAEECRRLIAITWLGEEFPKWYRPCRITVKTGPQLGAGGATTFAFDNGDVFGWRMTVQGTLERILDSVIPHEVCHTIMATHFRRPLPRWADEGMASSWECEAETKRQLILAWEVVGTQKEIPLSDLLTIQEYPTDMERVLTLYAQGYLLTKFLTQEDRGGRDEFLKLLELAHTSGWPTALRKTYGYENMQQLEEEWRLWVKSDCAPPPPPIEITQNDQ